ncbi:hypothetical protein EJF36_17640 [Bacillus sp. HMF5848]|uniref:hypothetical protein n=1 Tax=Bacillus sp. HMF5848 TaxID=2495421 RepID=UPI000F781162|nr:hypothetical protein [Bacillus sp. HMF5848]RSK28541.1 hypothetical protein EJF36_17640 [Bacillus sp. HMF5848]
MNNMMSSLFKMGGRNSFNMFRKKRRNGRGWMLGSIIGLGVSAALVGLGKNKNVNRPLEKVKNNFNVGDIGRRVNLAGLTEFSKELTPNNKRNNDK